jgi:ADP-ribosyl-[dinitrogen reductase] hydrolase
MTTPRDEPSTRSITEAVLLGTAIGDALGLACEGLSARVIAKRFGRVDRYRFFGATGRVSDDTEQSALVAQSLVRGRGELDDTVRAFRRAMVGWFWRLPWGIGWATLRACLKLTLGLRRSGVRSAGNGASMRAAIVGAHVRDVARREALARAIAEVTHSDPRAIEAAVFVANVTGAEGTSRERLSAARARLDEPSLVAVIDRAFALADEGASMQRAADVLGTSGFVVHTLALASFAFARLGERPLDELLPELYSVGGDTDSIGAIVGAWYGARHGREGLPQRWVERLQSGPFGRVHLEALARDLDALEHGRAPIAPARFSWVLAMARTLVFYPVVLAHGFRRLAPPY